MELRIFAIFLKSSSQLAILESSVDSFFESKFEPVRDILEAFQFPDVVVAIVLKFDPGT